VATASFTPETRRVDGLPAPTPKDGPIWYQGTAHHAVKGFWRGTQRTIAPAETLELIRPLFPRAGLTRLADITGLDRIGVPVTLSIRPNSQSLTVSAGKGFFREAALASAAMEGLELFHAEEAVLTEFRCAYRDLEGPRIAVEDLPLTRHNLFRESQLVRWTTGWDLIGQHEVAVPCSAVQMGLDPHRTAELHSFQLSSNGLASGNTLLEAINAALFEVVERDAVTCHRVAWDRHRTPPVVDPHSIPHPLVQELLDRFRDAGTSAVLFDCTVDTQVPVYMAYLYDLEMRGIGVYRGYGAHLDPEIAMTRALTEAAQGRAIYIAGSRDDVFRHSYLRLKAADDSRVVPTLQSLPPSVDASVRSSEAGLTFEADTQLTLSKLVAAGLRQAIVVNLSRPEFPISVVKVIVPGLEGYIFDFYTPGRRAKAFVEALAG
jgi:ribosomal protein S12 methylthiotransferase accessory factor